MPEPIGGPSARFLAHLYDNGNGQLLRDHLTAVSATAAKLAGKLGMGSAGELLGLLHDFGKYSGAFQDYLQRMAADQDTEHRDAERGTIDHSTAGAQTLWRHLRNKVDVQGFAAEILALCTASHHSGLIDCLAPDGVDHISRRMAKPDSASHYAEAWARAEPAITERVTDLLRASDPTTGVATVLASLHRADRNPTTRQFKVGLRARFLLSCLVDSDRTDTADSEKAGAARLRQHGRYLGWADLISLLERRLDEFRGTSAMDELRRNVASHCLTASQRPRGTLTLTVPTGGAKTLGSLRFALHHAERWQLDRILYFSPYTSITDQNADAVRKILEPSGTEFATVLLEHHSNLTPLKQTWRSKVLSENWDAPVVFTTLVQFLETLFGSGTRGVRRMHQLANSVLIFDEIQTLPIRCVHLFNNAINFLVEHCGSTVLLCTATQPLLHRVDPTKGAISLLINADLIPNAEGLFAIPPRHDILDLRKARGWEHAEAAHLAVSETRRAGSCLVIVNTKYEARSIYTACRATSDEIPSYHLSTNMCPAHRIEILAQVRKRLDHPPVLCVSTQLIEAGIDISFWSVIRALAGLDSIAQAAGRCNRDGRPGRGQVHVINLAGELRKLPPEIRKAQEAAQRVLDEGSRSSGEGTHDLTSPELIERYFRYYFFDRRMDMDYPVTAEQAQRDDTLLSMLSENRLAVQACTPRPAVFLRQAFLTAAEAFQAIDAGTQGVIVPYTAEGRALIGQLCAVREPRKQVPLLKRAQRFTVNVFPNVLRRLQQTGAVHQIQEGTGILYLNERYYSNEFGLSTEGTEEMEFQNA